GIAEAARKDAEVDPFEPQPRAVLELGEGVVEIRPRDHPEPDQAVPGDGAVFFPQPAVVGAHSGAIGLVVLHGAPEPRPHLLVGEAHLGAESRTGSWHSRLSPRRPRRAGGPALPARSAADSAPCPSLRSLPSGARPCGAGGAREDCGPACTRSPSPSRRPPRSSSARWAP